MAIGTIWTGYGISEESLIYLLLADSDSDEDDDAILVDESGIAIEMDNFQEATE